MLERKIDGRRRENCGACGKSTKLAEIKERILASAISNQKYAVSCCPNCFIQDVYVVQQKRPLKAETSQCDTCFEIFDVDTRKELEAIMDSHADKTEHRAFTVKSVLNQR